MHGRAFRPARGLLGTTQVAKPSRPDAMVVDAGADTPTSALTGRERHAQKVAAKRALRAEKKSLQELKWAIPKKTTTRRAERKELVDRAKALRRGDAATGTAGDAGAAAGAAAGLYPGAAADADAPDAPADEDEAMGGTEPTPAFAYAVDSKKARRAAKKRAKAREKERRGGGG